MQQNDRTASALSRTPRSVRAAALALSILVTATLAVVGASPASAAPTVISGEITCLNNASPVGVWVDAKSSRSGWATTKIPYVAGGHSKVTFTYTLNAGGAYRVNVGCGGSAARWGTSLSSGWLTASRVALKCNDIPDWLALISKRIFRVDLTQGIPYRVCR